jgi:TonB family protein
MMVSGQEPGSSDASSSQTASSSCKSPEQAGNPNQPAPGGEPFKVWVDSTAKVFYRWGSRYYGKTPCGQYMREADALAAGARHEGWYVDYIQKEVQRHWSTKDVDPKTPAGAKVVVGFAISREGSISDLRVVEASGWPTLDSSCIKAVQDVHRFDPLPAAYKKPSLTVAYSCTHQPPR